MHLFLYSLATSLHLSLELSTLSSFHAFEDRKVLNYSVCAEYVIFLDRNTNKNLLPFPPFFCYLNLFLCSVTSRRKVFLLRSSTIERSNRY